jgi:Outer membrane lipoprotein-sorting protein
MKRRIALFCSLLLLAATAYAEPLTAAQIVQQVLQRDPFGLSGAETSARIILTDKKGSTSQLVFSAKSMQHQPPLAQSLIRFSAPAELSGAAFLQVQKSGGDDDRFLFLPELKRTRRISGNLRASAFMGTDFSFADLDRRDIRDGTATLKGKETIGKFPCHLLEIVPKTSESGYSRLEAWIREDNFLPLRLKMYDRAGAHLKTFEAVEVKRVSNVWFISRSRMTNVKEQHTTELLLDQITVKNTYAADEFSVSSLEKL